MKTKRYRVWHNQGCYVDINAEKLETVSINERPTKVRFLDESDSLLAEFYCDRIEGWAEVSCLVNYNA